MRWQSYPLYKETSIKWIGEVPKEWNICRSDEMLCAVKENINTDLLAGHEVFHYSIPVVQETGNGQIEEGNYIDSSKTLISKSVLLVSKLNPRKGTIVAAHPHDILTVCSGEFVPLSPLNCDLRYAEYVYRSENVRQYLSSLVQSVTRSHQRVNPEDIRKVWWSWPSLKEQQTIASFLDRETVHIDSLISKKQRQIELLQEKRAALISHVVTKGLNPNVKMKDSGVEWLGEIPSDWHLKRLKYLTTQITVGIVITPSKYYVDSGVPCLRSLNVKEDMLTETDLVFISPESNELLCKSKLYRGDLVVIRTGQPGTTAVVGDRYDGANCIDLIIIRKSANFDSRFMCYVMNSESSKTQYLSGISGAIQGHFNIETASNMMIAVPSVEEQISIRNHLDNEIGEIKELVQKIELSIKMLYEYRTALISAAVTGKIDVRKEVA